MSNILKGLQLNEVDPRNFDSDWDYYDALNKKPRGRSEDDYEDPALKYEPPISTQKKVTRPKYDIDDKEDRQAGYNMTLIVTAPTTQDAQFAADSYVDNNWGAKKQVGKIEKVTDGVVQVRMIDNHKYGMWKPWKDEAPTQKPISFNEEQLDELSPETLDSYKKKASAQASELDKAAWAGQQPTQQRIEKANKRYSGIIGATKRVLGIKENAEELNMGDPVIITGNVQFNGSTGDIVGFSNDKSFVIVDLYNHGKRSFHSSDVSFNDYADSDDEQEYMDNVREGKVKDALIKGTYGKSMADAKTRSSGMFSGIVNARNAIEKSKKSQKPNYNKTCDMCNRAGDSCVCEDMPPPENARKTQIAGTLPTYKKAADILNKTGVQGKALDFGAGLGMGTAELGKDAHSYEPFPNEKFKPHFVDVTKIPDNSYHKIVNLNVLNVVPNTGEHKIRDSIVKNIGRVLAPGGVALITTRGKDVLTIKGTPGEEPTSMISKIGTYQKGFTQRELLQYIQQTLGKGFEVSSIKLGPAGVMIKKLDQQGVAEDTGDNKFDAMMSKVTSKKSLHAREALGLMNELIYQGGASYDEALQQASMSFEIDPAKLNALYQEQGLAEGYYRNQQSRMDYNKRTRYGTGGAAGDENDAIDARLRQQHADQQAQLAQYDQTGKFWLKRKDDQQHISDEFIGKQAARDAAIEMLKQHPELKGNIVITAWGPGETPVAEADEPKPVNMKRWLRDYERREDNNFHTENVLAIAKLVGTPEDVAIMKSLVKQHNGFGLSDKQFEIRHEIYRRLWPLVKQKIQASQSQELDEEGACWDNYKQIGMKPGKNGKPVPDCRGPIKESAILKGLKNERL